MATEKIRLLRANEIECRVSTINERGLSLLLYKDARADQRILDETFGIFGWKRSHQCIDGNLYCTVEVYDKENGCWVGKQDVGTTGFAEKEKSQASDSFKRACFNWSIGRELYTAPFIWVSADKVNIQKKGDRFYCNEQFIVRDIEYNAEREMIALVIANGKGQVMYELKTNSQSVAKPEDAVISTAQMKSLQDELRRTGVGMQAVMDRYHIQKPERMSPELYEKVMTALSRTKSAQAA